jgi:hypothetical protein
LQALRNTQRHKTTHASASRMLQPSTTCWGGVAETLDQSGCILRGRCLLPGISCVLVW